MERAKVPTRGLGNSMAEWREGELLPQGWDSMPLSQKVLSC